MKSHKKIQEILKEHKKDLAEKYKVKEIGLFGSYVRAEQGKRSDVDILVEFEEVPDLFKFIELERHLEGILGLKVDLVRKEAIRKELKDRFTPVEEFVGDMNFDEFLVDDKTSSAVVRKLEIIGEATKNIPKSITQEYEEIPWKEMVRMRDKIIHFYFGVDYEIVWNVIKERLPQIKPTLRRILEDMENDR